MGGSDQTGRDQGCFGKLEVVFPPAEDGLRAVSADCWDCGRRVDCLRLAVAADRAQDQAGIAPAQTDRQDGDGVGGFLRRWSRLKSQSARRK